MKPGYNCLHENDKPYFCNWCMRLEKLDFSWRMPVSLPLIQKTEFKICFLQERMCITKDCRKATAGRLNGRRDDYSEPFVLEFTITPSKVQLKATQSNLHYSEYVILHC